MTRLLPRYGLSYLGLLLLWVSAASAQPAPPPLPRRAKGAWLGLHVDGRGVVRASLHLPFQPRSSEMWKQALASMLNGSFQQLREVKTGNLWFLYVRADTVLDRSAWAIDGTFDLNALRDGLLLDGVGQLLVTVDHPPADSSECSLDDVPLLGSFRNNAYSADLPVSAPMPPIHLRFGFRRQIAWRFLPLALVLLAPIGLTLWRRRLRPGEGDRFAAWFRYWRFQRRLTSVLWCVWMAAAVSLGVLVLTNFLHFLLRGIFEPAEYVWVALFLMLPPALATLACRVLSAPAFARVPEVEWTRGRLLRRELWMQFGLVGMGVFLGRGVDHMMGNPRALSGLLYLVAAIGLYVLCHAMAQMSRNSALQILPPGPLRERLFELADQARVPVRQAYRVSWVPWRLLNALGVVDCVHVCAEAVPPLSRREVDALLALELARLWRRRPFALWRILGSLTLMIVLGAGGGLAAAFLPRAESLWRFVPILVVVGLVWGLRQPGHFLMSRLDREALKITGDPEALITALAKLRRLHLLPLVAGEERSARDGSVADWNRLHDLADRAGIPPERLDEILDGPGSGADRYPPLESAPDLATGADPRVFSREFKRRAVFRQSWSGLAVEIAIPVLIAYVAQMRQWHGVVLALVYPAGLPLTVLLRKVVVRRLAVAASRALRRGVREKLARDGLFPEAWGGVSVSLSPHSEPRLYEHFLIWDPGFLVLSGDRLGYLGDQTRFALERRHIRDVYLGPGPPGWFASRRVYVSWRDDERGTGGVFNLTVNERSNWWRPAARQADLARRLRDWLKQPADATEVPPLRDLPAPDLGAVPSESIGKFASVNVLLGLLFLRSPFAIGACLLLGLSFDLHSGAAGWYVLGSTALLQVITVLSFLPYRRRSSDGVDQDAPTPGSD
ncbi:MAG TPA: hypothetical protein VH643_21220 [Gemmataceae bacterium]|jgi:hypothetical protein